ncbi:MAG: hypothetical protein Q8882_02400 [Bacillota bacterium]|nr:hypothetical protein [Bacillota bacterium]
MAKIIMGVQLQQRIETATDVQDLLTKYGCYIKTRLGMHQQSEDACSEKGLIILEFVDKADKEAYEFETEISKIDNVVVQKMEF